MAQRSHGVHFGRPPGWIDGGKGRDTVKADKSDPLKGCEVVTH